MKIVHRLLGILIAFCLMWILFITSIQAVVYWNPGYFEKEYTKYQVLDDLPPMTMEDLLEMCIRDRPESWKMRKRPPSRSGKRPWRKPARRSLAL